MAMISEENKEDTHLGKRIKRLGVHYLLKKSAKPEYCSSFMIKTPWKIIDKLCRECGF